MNLIILDRFALIFGLGHLAPELFDSVVVNCRMAQMERELLIERTRAGLEAARKRGRVGGRKRSMTPAKVEAAKKLLDQGMPPKDVAQNLGVSIPTLYRWCPASERS